MKLFKKKCRLVKKTLLTKNGWQTIYFTEVNGRYVSESYARDKEKAELFFNKILENEGATERKEIIKEKRV